MPKRKRASREIIGCNIRKGVTPGGFANPTQGTAAERAKRSNALGANSNAIKEAASIFLEKRGIRPPPSLQSVIDHEAQAAIASKTPPTPTPPPPCSAPPATPPPTN